MNKFLQNHFQPSYEKNRINDSKQITYEFLVEEGVKMMDVLATYFATEARIRCKDEAPLLSMNAADGYFSAFKMMLIHKFDSDKAEEFQCFAPLKWKRLRESLISIKTDYAKKQGIKLVNGQDMADDEEVESLACLCIWHGTEKGISFFAFNKLMYHLIARCCESAG